MNMDLKQFCKLQCAISASIFVTVSFKHKHTSIQIISGRFRDIEGHFYQELYESMTT